MPTSEEVYERLRLLGSTAEEVARSLQERGIKGCQRDGCDCPLFHFLKAEFGEHGLEIIICPGQVKFGGKWIDMPEGAELFRLRFDHSNDFPELRR